VDGHCSHQNGDFIAVCMKNKVNLMILPPHTSHVTQPLDVGVFSSYKHHMRKLAGQDLRYSPNNRLPRAVWLSHLARARKNALTRSNILAGFRKAGISPFNREKLLKQARTPGESPPSIRRAPLACLTTENAQSAESRRQKAREVIKGLGESLQREHAEKTLLQDELRHLREYKKKERKSHTPKQLGTHEYSQPRVLAVIQADEAVVNNRKRVERPKLKINWWKKYWRRELDERNPMVPVSPRCVHSSMHTSDEQLRACEVEGMNGSKLHVGANYVTPSNFLQGDPPHPLASMVHMNSSDTPCDRIRTPCGYHQSYHLPTP